MPRNQRRSSILKPPKQVMRSPLQDLDNNDGETLRQPASCRASFSRTSQIKECDPATGCPTKWTQNDDSLENFEGAENQPESSNAFDEHSSIQTQKKSKRKRTPTMQPSLNASNIEANGRLCSVLNQSLQQSPCARVLKQPRKSVDCSKTDILEEGDTALFLDELNLTDTIKCSSSCIDMSTNLTRTMIDSVLDSSDADSCGSKIDLPEAYLSNNSSISFGKDVSKTLIGDDEDSMDDAPPNKGSNVLDTESNINGDVVNMCESLKISDGDVFMESTLHAEEIEAVNSFINVEHSMVTQIESSEEVISNITLSIEKDDIELENSKDISATVTSDNDNLLPTPNKDTKLDESKASSCESDRFETSMDLTIPQLINQDLLPKIDHKEGNVLLTQCLHDNDQDTVDLDMTVALGQIVKKRASESGNISDNLTDKMKSLADSLDADKMCMKDKLADTVSPDLEKSMTNLGITIKENMGSQGSNSIDESGFIYEDDAEIGAMDLTVPLGKLEMLRVKHNSEKIDAFKSLEASELLYSPNSTFVGKNEDESLLKEITERNSFEGTVNSFSGSEDFDETFANMHGMDMTVPLGKISENIPKPLCENTMQHSGGTGNPALEEESKIMEESKNMLSLEEILEEDNEKTAESNAECQTHGNELKLCNDEVTSHGESQEMNETDLEAGMISVTATLHEENFKNISDNMESSLQMSDETNPKTGGMDATCTPVISKEEFDDPINSSRAHNTIFDDTNTDIMGVDSNAPLEYQESKLLEDSNETESAFPMVDVTRPESVSPGKTLPIQNNQSDHFQDFMPNAIAEGLDANHANSDIVRGLNAEICEDNLEAPAEFQMNDTNSEEMDMEITVSLESLKGDKYQNSVDNFYPENHIMDETNSDAMGMELTIPIGRVKGMKQKDPVDDSLAQAQVLNASRHDVTNIERSLLEGRSNEVEGCQNVENSPVNRTVEESQILSDLTLEAVGEDPLVEENANLTCSLLVEPQKLDDPNLDVVAEEMSVTQSEMHGGECESDAINEKTLEIESAVPVIELKEDNVINVEDLSTESKHVADTTLMAEEMSVTQGDLQGGECKNDETNSKADVIAENQKADDSNAEVMSVELCHPQVIKAIEDEGLMIKGVDNTLLEVESTAPIALLEEGNISHANGITTVSQQIDGTIPDEVDMDFTVPMGISKVIKDEDIKIKNDLTANTIAESQVTNLEAMGVESILMVEEDERFTLNVTAESQELNDVNPDSMNVEMSVLEEELQEVTQEINEIPTITECQILDDTNSETLAMASTAELKLNNSHHEEKIIAESEQIGKVNPAEIGMESFIPLGGLKGNKHEDCGNAGELGLQLVDKMSPDAGEIEKVVPLVSLEDKRVSESCNDIGEEPQAENETSIKKLELDKSGVELKDTVPQVDNESQAVESTDLMVRQLFISSEGQDCESSSDDNLTKPILSDGINVNEVGMEFIIPPSVPDEQEEIYSIPDRLQDCYPDTFPRDIQLEQKISFEMCDEKMIPEEEGIAVECQGSEEVNSEGVNMEQSISEAMDNELQAVDSKNTELEAITETSINEEELMVVPNTPIKKPEITKVSPSPAPIMVKLEIDIGHTNTFVNKVSAASDGSPVLIIARNEQQLDMSACEGNALSYAGAFPKERLPTEESDVTSDVQVQTKLNISCAEMESPVPLRKSKLYDEVNESAVSLPSQFNTSVEVNGDVESSNADITNQFNLVDDNSIIKNDSSIITLEIVPDIYSVSMSGLGDNHSHVDPSLAQANTSDIHSEELAMEGVSFCERDFLMVDDDCLGNMVDTSIEETLDPDGNESSCELKPFHQYELDCTSRDESGESQLDHTFSNLEEMRVETSSFGANASDSSTANVAVNASVQEDSASMLQFSIEDWIKQESSKQPCNWKIYKLVENQYSFVVFHESALLIVNLQPLLEGEDYRSIRIVESVVLESCFTDDHDRCLKVIMNVMLKRLSSSLLSSKCSSTDQLPSLFDFLGAEFSALNLLLLQTYELMKASPVRLKSDGLMFMVSSVQRLLLFEVQINLLNWDKDGVKSDDVQVKNIIGSVEFVDIQSIFQSVKCDDHYLRNIYNEVLKFRFIQEKVLA